MKDFDGFKNAYIGTALEMLSLDQRDEGNDDANYDIEDLAPDALEAMTADARVFWNRNGAYIKARAEHNDRGEWTIEQRAGTSFWFNRNGHGTGFWDYEELWGPYTTKFDDDSKWFGESNLYVGDDGKIYLI